MSKIHEKFSDEIADDDYLSIQAVSELLGIDAFSLVALDLNHQCGSIFPQSHPVEWPDGRDDIGWLYRELKEYAIAKVQQQLAASTFNWDVVSLPRFMETYGFSDASAKTGKQDYWISRDTLWHTLKFDPRDQAKAIELSGADFPKPHMVTIDETEGPVERWLDSEVQTFCRGIQRRSLPYLAAKRLGKMIMDQLS